MAKVRYVIMVPQVVEEDVIETRAYMAEHGRFLAEGYGPVKSVHPKKGDADYRAYVVEACVVKTDEPLKTEPMFNIDELIAPGVA